MKIPDKIKIGARTYHVRYVDSDPDSDHTFDNSKDGLIFGEIDYRNQNIKLLDGPDIEQMEQALLHEIVHGIAYDMGYCNEHNEREIELLANALHRLIQDNPKLFSGD